MAVDRARRAELLKRAKAIRRACQQDEMTMQETCEEILSRLPEILPLEAWRVAHGWSRSQCLAGITEIYEADGLPEPGINSAMLCRWEHGVLHPGSEYRAALCRLYKATPEQLGLRTRTRRHRAAAPAATTHVVTVSNDGGDEEKENPMRRRTMIAAVGTVGLSVPMHLLQNLEDALAVPVEPGRPEGLAQIQKRLQVARHQFDTSALTALIDGLPTTLAVAGDTATRVNSEAGWALLSSFYCLATDALNKVGRKGTATRTADRGVMFADRSGDAVAMGYSARAMGMMLRTTGQHRAASQVVGRAAARLEATGLRKASQTGVYVRLLCTSAYTAAGAGDRAGAFATIAEAEKAAARLALLTGKPEAEPFVSLYKMNINNALGDAGAALEIGKDLRPEMYLTPERRGRLHTDMARSWWMWGKPDPTAMALLSAHREAPSEVRDRPTIRKIADDLTALYPRAAGVRQLSATLSGMRPA